MEEIDFEYEHGQAHELLTSVGVAHGDLPERVEDLVEEVEKCRVLVAILGDKLKAARTNSGEHARALEAMSEEYALEWILCKLVVNKLQFKGPGDRQCIYECDAFSESEWYRLGIRYFGDQLQRHDLPSMLRERYRKAHVEFIGKWAGALFRARELVYNRRQRNETL